MTKTCKVLGVKSEIDILDVVIKLKKCSEDIQCAIEDGWDIAGYSVSAAGVLSVKLKYKDDKDPKMTERFDLFDLSEMFCRNNLAWVQDKGITKLLML